MCGTPCPAHPSRTQRTHTYKLATLAAPPNPDDILAARDLPAALEEMGLNLADRGLEAERARFEVLCRDERALERRFERWFPQLEPERGAPTPRTSTPETPTPESADAALLEALEVMLLTVAEFVTYLDGAPLQRRLDAIEILERLLLEGGVAPWEYARAQRSLTETARRALGAVRAAVQERQVLPPALPDGSGALSVRPA
ncbi:MAG: hypothetical protein JW751_08460 [Polyangiaceae bacterium]|nr:hypothetical protein [Polyangiaceae bacterium]